MNKVHVIKASSEYFGQDGEIIKTPKYPQYLYSVKMADGTVLKLSVQEFVRAQG